MSLKRIFEFAKVRRGASPRPIGDSKFFGGDVGWVRIGDVTASRKYLRSTSQYLSPLGEKNSVRVNPGDLIMSICGTVGRPILIDMPACIHDGFVQLYDLKEAEPEFLYYALDFIQDKIASVGQSGTQTNLNTTIVGSFQVFLPTKSHQERIAEILSAVDRAIEQTEALIAKYQRIKTGLMQDFLTRGIDEHGRLRDPQANPQHFKDSLFGKIPKAWETCTLGELVDASRPIVYGILMPGTSVSGGVPVVKVKDIIDGAIDLSDLLLTHPRIDEAYRRSRLRSGDLLFTIRGTVGRTAFVPDVLAGANITQDTARIGITKANPKFVRHFVDMPIPRTFIEMHTIGQAVRGINLAEVRRIPLLRPPLKEQAALAEILDAQDMLSQEERWHLEKLKKLKTGLMQDLLTGKVSVEPLLAAN